MKWTNFRSDRSNPWGRCSQREGGAICCDPGDPEVDEADALPEVLSDRPDGALKVAMVIGGSVS